MTALIFNFTVAASFALSLIAGLFLGMNNLVWAAAVIAFACLATFGLSILCLTVMGFMLGDRLDEK